ncbi:MAG: hypothetical protein H6873_13000 [Hyphomicrobiaceae bacterium]|nr:hypothetical protein [Hyphomicrobiaceae bacterium]
MAQSDAANPAPTDAAQTDPNAVPPAGDASQPDTTSAEMPADQAAAGEGAGDGAAETVPDAPAEPEKPTWEPFGAPPKAPDPVNLDTPLIGPYLTDPLTGVALSGYDPVSYFTEADPEKGSSAFEYYWQGVSWYFASNANLENFKRAPEYYAPQFGGHGAMSMARGYLSQGDPLIYLVLDDELFLFYSAGNRVAFESVRNSARLDARENWARLREGLVPN